MDKMRAFKDPNIPLTHKNDKGEDVPTFFMIIDGNFCVHPDRWELFTKCIEHIKAAVKDGTMVW